MERKIGKLYIEPTSRCNLNCVMCFRHTWVDEGFGDLPLEYFYKAINDERAMSQAHTVFFGGQGEPLVHPNIIEMITACSAKGLRVEMITNGTMLSEQMCLDLLNAGLKKLWISIDSFESGGYEKIQVGSFFDGMKKRLRRFNAARDAWPEKVELGVAFVLMKSNAGQLPLLKDFVDEMGVDDVNLSHMIYNTLEGADESLYNRTLLAETMREFDVELLHYDMEKAYGYDDEPQKQYCDKARFEFLERDFEQIEGLRQARSMFNDRRQLMWEGRVIEREVDKCRFIEEDNCFIRWDGDITPCMGLLHSAQTALQEDIRMVWHKAYGNLKDTYLWEAWESEEYSSFRERVLNFEFSPCVICGGCDLREENKEDCLGNVMPTCGACIWSQGLIRCP